MQHKNVTDVLARMGLGKDGDVWNVPSGLAATVYLSLDEESLIIDRVTKLEVTPEVAYATTARRERYAFELDTLRALRFVSEK
jgi:hypothetical protein